MLSRETMGLAALAILWVNTFLIVLANGQLAGAVARRWGRFRRLSPGTLGTGLLELKLVGGGGAGGAAASQRVSQVGRYSTAKPEEILFQDTEYTSECHGGHAMWGVVPVELVATTECQVWPTQDQLRLATACPDPETFNQAHEASRRVHGFRRTITTFLAAGETVWAYGTVVPGDAGTFRLRPGPGEPLVLSAADPRLWCRNRMLAFAASQMAIVFGAAVCTWLVFVPPVFEGTFSVVGGVSSLAFFVLVQPLGRALAEFGRLPYVGVVRGRWVRPSPTGARGSQAGKWAPN